MLESVEKGLYALSQRQDHTLAIQSTLPLTKTFYFISIVVIKWLCAFSIFLKHLPLLKSHILMLLSSLEDIKYFPLGWKSMSVTQLSCPTSVKTHLPYLASHNLIVLSLDPDAK